MNATELNAHTPAQLVEIVMLQSNNITMLKGIEEGLRNQIAALVATADTHKERARRWRREAGLMAFLGSLAVVSAGILGLQLSHAYSKLDSCLHVVWSDPNVLQLPPTVIQAPPAPPAVEL